MSRVPEALSRIEILVLSTLARRPMHGYELKLELRYKHVRWWAKAEHGHLYATLERLARRGHIERVGEVEGETKRVYGATDSGLARVRAAVIEICAAPDQTYFDVDLFLSSAFMLPKKRVLALLEERARRLQAQLEEARELRATMDAVPTVAKLIIDHRVTHLEREIAFATNCARALRRDKKWGPFLGRESIRVFIQRTGAPLE